MMTHRKNRRRLIARLFFCGVTVIAKTSDFVAKGINMR